MKFFKNVFFVSLIYSLIIFGCTNRNVNSLNSFEINYNTLIDEEETNGTKVLYQEVKYPDIKLKSGHGTTEISNYIAELNTEFKNSASSFLNDNKEYAREIFKEIGNNGGNFEHDEEITIERFDDKVLSLTSNCYEYTMGAHGLTIVVGHNYDVKNNKRIVFNEIINDKVKLKESIVNYLDNEFNENLDQNYKSTIDSFLNGKYEMRFLVTKDGINIIFNQYDIAAYAVGIITVPINYVGNEDVFSTYFKSLM